MDSDEELLRHRYLCRGGGLLLAGPTGIGKSSLSMQFMISWALGRPVFGIEPARPIKSATTGKAGGLKERNRPWRVKGGAG